MELNTELDDFFKKIIKQKNQKNKNILNIFKKLTHIIKKDNLIKIINKYNLEELSQDSIIVKYDKDDIYCECLIITEKPKIKIYIKDTIDILILPRKRDFVIQSFFNNVKVFKYQYTTDVLMECLQKTTLPQQKYTVEKLSYLIKQIEEQNILNNILNLVIQQLQLIISDN